MAKFNDVNVKKVIYTGCFLTQESIELIRSKGFPCEIEDTHMTLEFFGNRECDFPAELFGEEVTLLVDGAGKYEEEGVEKNYGFHISDMSLNLSLSNGQTLRNLFKGEVPHITLKVSNSGKPVDTYKCKWWSIQSFTIKAKIGAVERRQNQLRYVFCINFFFTKCILNM